MSENIYKSLFEELENGKKTVMITAMDNSKCENKPFGNKMIFTEESLLKDNCLSDFDEIVLQNAKNALKSGKLQFLKVSGDEEYLIEPYFPEPKLIVLGGGNISKHLVEFGSKAGFSVTVIDDRPYFANRERFPEAEKVICESFEKCFDLINLNKSTFVVIVTRGHRYDTDCLRQALKYDTAYLGMIGSKRRVKATMEQMLDEGYSKEKLDKVNAPIGLKIGAVTPEEIAFSVIAQLIQYRRIVVEKNGSIKPLKANWPEFDRDVLMELSKEENSSKAIITIISTKGSVPRRAGAKMIVWSNGKIVGTIGGGCSEGDVINNARYLLRNGGYEIQSIDMTGEVAEDEGMVCGGIMDVVIESFYK